MEFAKIAADAGHEIGNHSYNHRNTHGILSTQKVAEEIAQCNGAITKATGVHTHYYRPPFGVTNPNIASAVGHSNMQAIGWDIRSLDTTTNDADALLIATEWSVFRNPDFEVLAQKLKNKIV